MLVRGEVRPNHLRQIVDDDLSKTLSGRVVPSLVWRETQGELVLAPTEPLVPGETYGIASGEPPSVVHLIVEREASAPLLERVWPPVDVFGGTFGVYCGREALREGALFSELAPEGPAGSFLRGIVDGGAGAACLRFVGRGRLERSGGPWVPPPGLAWLDATRWVSLDPRPLGGDGVEGEGLVSMVVERVECGPGEVRFGPGCVLVEDDRLIGRAPEALVLWGIAGEGLDVVMTTEGGQRFVLKGLLAEKAIALDVATVDVWGRGSRETFEATMLSPMAHVVLNEVLANPNGPEPHQEWVELYNDGLVEADLGQLSVCDIGGETALPSVLLPPGRFGLVVNETYVPDDEVDVAPAEGTILVRVPALGKGGLSNGGEVVRLVDGRGGIVSRFPAIPKPKAGWSVSRVSPDAPDGVSESFVLALPTPGWSNDIPRR